MIDQRTEGRHAKIRRAVGAFLCVTAALAAVFWLSVVIPASGSGRGTFSVGPFTGSGLVQALIATPTVMAAIVSQFVLGVGLWKGRPWVGWYSLMYVLGGLVASILGRSIPSDSWMTLTLPLFGALPGGILLWRRLRPSIPEEMERRRLS